MQKHFSWLSRKELRHLLLLYITIATIILAILVPSYWFADKLFVESELSRYQATLDRGAVKLNSTVAGIANAITSTRQGNSFLSLRYYSQNKLNPTTLMEQQNIFKGLLSQQDIILESGLIFDEELVLTNTWVFYPGMSTSFYPTMFRCNGLDFDEWMAMLKETGTGFLPEMNYYTGNRWDFDAITYTTSWGTQATFYALILSSDIQKMFIPNELLSQVSFCLTSFDGTVIYALGDTPASNVYTLSTEIGHGDLLAVLNIPSVAVNSSLRALRRTVIFYLGAVLLIAITLTILFAYVAISKPLSSLYKRLPFASMAGTKHLSAPSSSYRGLAEGIISMDHTIVTQKNIIGWQYFEIALVRGFLSCEEAKRIEQFIPNFPSQYRLVLYRLNAATPEQYEQGAALCQDAFPSAPLHLMDGDSILVVADAAHFQFDEAAKVRDVLQKALGLSVTAVASEEYKALGELHDAWVQLTNIECCAPWISPADLRTVKDLPEKRMVMPLSMQDLHTLYNALNAGNLPLARSVLENCTTLLMEKEDGNLLYHHTYLIIRRMLRQLQLENPVILKNLSIPAYERHDHLELFSISLPACIESICQAISDARAVSAKNSAYDILEYLNRHLASPDLCINSVAEHFDISSTTLQRLCKENTGMTVAVYIETQRLSKACELLTQTGITIAQVAQECGFNSSNSFYKAFKRRYGRTPRSISESNE